MRVARAGWCGDYNEASTFLTLMESGNTTGGIHYQSKEYDVLIEKALSSTSDDERAKIYLDAEASANQRYANCHRFISMLKHVC